MLRWVWRKRKPRRKGHTRNESPASFGVHSGNHDTRENVDQTIKEEGEGEVDIKPAPIPVKRDSVSQSQNSTNRRESNSSSTGSDGFDAAHRKGSSALTAVSEGAELSFAVRPPYRSSVTSIPTPGRRSSWLPSPTDMAALRARRKSSLASPRSQSFASHDGGHEGLPALHRPRRISSTGPLTLPDGISAWNRKPSVMSIPSDDDPEAVRSLDLVRSAWILLEASVKHYKMCLNILVDSNLPPAHLARAKNETLIDIAYCATFMASLAPRFSLAAEK